MYHCHFEPVEHIQMGMIGPLITRPSDFDPQNSSLKTAYGAGTNTEYDREYFLLLTELDPVEHESVLNVQMNDWSEFKPSYWLINGRSYPDTANPSTTGNLSQQPYPCFIQANEGERVLLRFINLGFHQHTITVLGQALKNVALDARLLRGANGEDLSRMKELLCLAPGQTADCIIQPQKAGMYPLFNRGYHLNTNAGINIGGMMTHVQVFPAGTLPPQVTPGL